jgi:beta-glucosidase
VTIDLANTGNYDGQEIAQLYLQDKVGSITRPVKELRGFKKIMLKKGEKATLTFTLSTDDLAFYHPDLKKYWEPGEFVIYVGTNSANTLSATIDLK